MGGIGSGRHWHFGASSTTADYRRIDVRRWAREGLLEPGRRFGWQWSCNGKVTGSITVQAETGEVHLIYRSREGWGDWESMEYPVPLLSQPMPNGASRTWFACPARGCGRRVAILYGGRVFACRHCYGLAYPSQRQSRLERRMERANTLRERLGWPLEECFWGHRPKGMHNRTFQKLVAELRRVELSVSAELAMHLGRLNSLYAGRD